MEKENYPCPCGGKVKWKEKEVIIDNVNCGNLWVERCDRCGSEYFPEESMKIIEQKLKQKGLWGMQRKEVIFWKSGNSVVLRIPRKIANTLDIKANQKAFMYPEGENKLIIEI